MLKNATARYLAGEVIADLARELGVSEAGLRKAIAKSGVHRPRISSGPARKLSAEQEKMVTDERRGGKTIAEIARDTGIPRTTIKRTLERAGCDIVTDGYVSPLPIDDALQLVADHVAGASLDVVAEKFKISKGGAFRIVKRHGASKGRGTRRRRGYTLNEGAFDALTPEACYWMGFLFTDGSVRQDAWGAADIGCNLAACDRGHLEKLLAFLGSNHAITEIPAATRIIRGEIANCGPAVGIKIRSKRLVAALLAAGMEPRKAKRAPCAALVASRDFWRGSVDGDGGVYDNSSAGLTAMLCGQIALIESFRGFLLVNDLQVPAIGKTRSGIFRVQFTGDGATGVIEHLYRNACTFLDRKHAIAIQAYETFAAVVQYRSLSGK